MAAPATAVSLAVDQITPALERPAERRQEKAAKFLTDHGQDVEFTYDEERSVLRRVDMRVLPLLLGAYFFQQLDKSSLRYDLYLTR